MHATTRVVTRTTGYPLLLNPGSLVITHPETDEKTFFCSGKGNLSFATNSKAIWQSLSTWQRGTKGNKPKSIEDITDPELYELLVKASQQTQVESAFPAEIRQEEEATRKLM